MAHNNYRLIPFAKKAAKEMIEYALNNEPGQEAYYHVIISHKRVIPYLVKYLDKAARENPKLEVSYLYPRISINGHFFKYYIDVIQKGFEGTKKTMFRGEADRGIPVFGVDFYYTERTLRDFSNAVKNTKKKKRRV